MFNFYTVLAIVISILGILVCLKVAINFRDHCNSLIEDSDNVHKTSEEDNGS